MSADLQQKASLIGTAGSRRDSLQSFGNKQPQKNGIISRNYSPTPLKTFFQAVTKIVGKVIIETFRYSAEGRSTRL